MDTEPASHHARLCDVETVKMSPDELGHTVRYFGGWGSYRLPPALEEPLTREQALARDTYYIAVTDGAGRIVRFEKYSRRRPIRVDQYDYWPSGRLKSQTITAPDGVTRINHFDERGRMVKG